MRESGWYRFIYSRVYRSVMRVSHYFNWHYAPKIGPLDPDMTHQKWCKWCGLRMTYLKDRIDPPKG